VSGSCGAFHPSRFVCLLLTGELFLPILKLGAWLIERPGLGRRLSLAGSTFLTAILCVGFVLVRDPIAVTVTTVGISLSSSVRGISSLSACGVNIKRVSMTGHVGCALWVSHGPHLYSSNKAEFIPCPYQAGRPRYLPRKVSWRRLRIFCWLN
jgi:hypothetical protein